MTDFIETPIKTTPITSVRVVPVKGRYTMEATTAAGAVVVCGIRVTKLRAERAAKAIMEDGRINDICWTAK